MRHLCRSHAVRSSAVPSPKPPFCCPGEPSCSRFSQSSMFTEVYSLSTKVIFVSIMSLPCELHMHDTPVFERTQGATQQTALPTSLVLTPPTNLASASANRMFTLDERTRFSQDYCCTFPPAAPARYSRAIGNHCVDA
ncbi:unnamed protein product [Ectocarpus fasciculatus]